MTRYEVPPVKDWFQDGFHRFLRPFLKRHFHLIAVERESLEPLDFDAATPLVIYGNHPSWWDPLIAHFLNRALFRERQFYAPIDARALEQYGVFEKLGFYGVQLDSLAGAGDFLKRSLAIAEAGGTAIWITPEGRFADVRDHAADLMPGLPHLCRRLSHGVVLPLALEYVFWDERLPNCLTEFGTPIRLEAHRHLSKPDWNAMLTASLRETQSRLAARAVARSAEPFENLLRGRPGAGTVYDSMRRLKAWASGKEFRAAHGDPSP